MEGAASFVSVISVSLISAASFSSQISLFSGSVSGCSAFAASAPVEACVSSNESLETDSAFVVLSPAQPALSKNRMMESQVLVSHDLELDGRARVFEEILGEGGAKQFKSAIPDDCLSVPVFASAA